MKDNDYAMRRYAASRGDVLVEMPDGQVRPASLISWKPTGSARRARVAFRSGKECTVSLDRVAAPTGTMVLQDTGWYRQFDNGHLVPLPPDEVERIETARAER